YLYSGGATRELHSFPTRRSSDLCRGGRVGGWDAGNGVGDASKGLIAQPSRVSAAKQRTASEAGEYGPSSPCLPGSPEKFAALTRSEEHTSELQSRGHLVCRLLLE